MFVTDQQVGDLLAALGLIKTNRNEVIARPGDTL